MGAITLTEFGGILPRRSERLLPDNAAQRAVNCRLSSGEAIPFNTPKKTYTSAKTGPLLAIHRISESGSSAWLTWPVDADAVKAPLYGTGVWCYTGDGEPRMTSMADAVSGSGNDYPHTFYTLGTPAPVAAPAVAPSGGVGATVDRYYGYTLYADWNGKELEGALSVISSLTSGKVDGTWAITGMEAPSNSGTVTGVHSVGYTTFTDTVNTYLRAGEQVVISGDTLEVAEIVSTKVFKVPGDYSAATTWARLAPFPTLKKRLYRTTGTTGQWQLVADGITATSYNDTLTDSQIPGDELISTDWAMPPVDLTSLFLLPSGALAGISGNKLCLSEPYQPQAWPAGYQLQMDHIGVAAACFGTGVVVGTEDKPFIIQGTTPGQMTGESWEESLPCVSKRSMVALGDVVVFSTPGGLYAANGAGCMPWSLPYFTEKEFPDYEPDTMICAVAGRRLFARYQGETIRTLIFNLLGDDPYLTETHFDADALYADAGRLYFSWGSNVYECDPSDGYAMTQDWQSKEIVLPAPQNLGAAKVNFSNAIDPAQAASINAQIATITAANTALVASGKVHGAWAASRYASVRYAGSDIDVPPEVPPENEVTFMLYAGGELKASRTLTNSLGFRLPSGFKADTVSVRVISKCRIKSIEVAETMKGLNQS